jgi:hypothetical protein
MPTLLETIGIMDPKAKEYLERYLSFNKYNSTFYKANKELLDNKLNRAFKNLHARLPDAHSNVIAEGGRTRYLTDLCDIQDVLCRYRGIEREYFILLNTLENLLDTDIADLPKVDPIGTIDTTTMTTGRSPYDNIDGIVKGY